MTRLLRNIAGSAVLFAGLLFSCTAPMNIDVDPEDARLVIYSTLFDAEINQKITVQRTVPYFSTGSAGWVDDARVTITTSEGDTYPAIWNADEMAYLTVDTFSTAVGVTYNLDVEYDFDADGTPEHYTATTTTYEPLQLEAMSATPFEMPMARIPMYQLAITGQDPPGRTFYLMRVSVNGRLYSELSNWITVGDRMFQDGRFEEFPLGIFPGEEPEDDPGRVWFTQGDEVTLHLSVVEMDFMRFVSEAQSSGGSNPLFGGPPYNIRTNISGGAIGFFGSVYSTPISSVVAE